MFINKTPPAQTGSVICVRWWKLASKKGDFHPGKV